MTNKFMKNKMIMIKPSKRKNALTGLNAQVFQGCGGG